MNYSEKVLKFRMFCDQPLEHIGTKHIPVHLYCNQQKHLFMTN